MDGGLIDVAALDSGTASDYVPGQLGDHVFVALDPDAPCSICGVAAWRHDRYQRALGELPIRDSAESRHIDLLWNGTHH